jgi:hypothetical protein
MATIIIILSQLMGALRPNLFMGGGTITRICKHINHYNPIRIGNGEVVTRRETPHSIYKPTRLMSSKTNMNMMIGAIEVAVREFLIVEKIDK